MQGLIPFNIFIIRPTSIGRTSRLAFVASAGVGEIITA